MDTALAPSSTEQTDHALAARIFVVVPTYQEAGNIERCLVSLLEDDEALKHVQCFVMDGDSDDGTIELVADLKTRFPQIELHHNPKRKQAAAVNLAATLAGPDRDILIRCDAHMIYPPGYILDLSRALLRKDANSIVVPMDAVAHDGTFAKANAAIVDTPIGSGGSAHRGGTQSGYVDHGHHAAMNLDAFQSVGGYDETMVANEDAELDTRLRAAGHKIWLDANIRPQYVVRKSPAALWRQYFNYGEGRADHVLRHRTLPKGRQLAPFMHVIGLTLSVAAFHFTPFWWVYPIVYLLLTTFLSWGYSFTRGKFVGWFSPLPVWIMHTSWGLGFLRGLLLKRDRKEGA